MDQKTLKEYYEEELRKPTPAQTFITRVAQATCRSENTVRMWLSGKQYPNQTATNIIAALLGADPTTLFKRPDDSSESGLSDNPEQSKPE